MTIFGTLLKSCNSMAPLLLCWIDVLSFVWFLRKATSFVFCHVVDTAVQVLLIFSCIFFSLSKDSLGATWEFKLVVFGKYFCGNIAYFLSDLEIHQSPGLSSQTGSRFRMHDYCICLEGFMAFWWSWT